MCIYSKRICLHDLKAQLKLYSEISGDLQNTSHQARVYIESLQIVRDSGVAVEILTSDTTSVSAAQAQIRG